MLELGDYVAGLGFNCILTQLTKHLLLLYSHLVIICSLTRRITCSTTVLHINSNEAFFFPSCGLHCKIQKNSFRDNLCYLY